MEFTKKNYDLGPILQPENILFDRPACLSFVYSIIMYEFDISYVL